ncbi:MAG: virulence RhuM family protein [Paramuribaculum sp.]|nr:virulence RhuM family protein [Paramuribaculum sp.]
MESNQLKEIILYNPDDTLALDVRVEDESVWLTQAQMAELFQTTRNNITLHTRNIFKEGELVENSVSKESLLAAKDGKKYRTKLYNLDVIISVGYRVKSVRGTQFRIWALQILKDYLLRGYSINQRLMQLEDRIDRRLSEHDRHLLQLDEKVDFFVRSSLQPKEGVFFNGQIFDAYALVSDLIRKAVTRIVVIDNYLDDSVLIQLSKRQPGVTLHKYTKAHDRFLVIDEDVYHIGASLKDLGKKLFAFSKMEVLTGPIF